MQIDIKATVTIAGKPANQATGPGRVVVTMPDWPSVFTDVDYKNGNPSYRELGDHDLGEFAPGTYLIRVAHQPSDGKLSLQFPITVPAAATSPAPQPPAVVLPPLSIGFTGFLRTAISDVGSAADNSWWMRAAGFNAFRIWASWDAQGAIGMHVITRARAYKALGYRVTIMLTPDKPEFSTVFPAAGIQAIATAGPSLVDLCIIINEPNLAIYWLGGNVATAFAMAARISRQIQAAGIPTASPAIVEGRGELIRQYLADAKAAGHFPFDVTAIHIYPKFDAGWRLTPVKFAENVLDAAATAGKPVYVDETGLDNDFSEAAGVDVIPDLVTLYELKSCGYAYFICTKTNDPVNKPTHDRHLWFFDPRTGTRRDNVIAVFANANK